MTRILPASGQAFDYELRPFEENNYPKRIRNGLAVNGFEERIERITGWSKTHFNFLTVKSKRGPTSAPSFTILP